MLDGPAGRVEDVVTATSLSQAKWFPALHCYWNSPRLRQGALCRIGFGVQGSCGSKLTGRSAVGIVSGPDEGPQGHWNATVMPEKQPATPSEPGVWHEKARKRRDQGWLTSVVR